MVNARVGRELGPQLPPSVPFLRTQPPPLTVRGLGFSMVAVGCDAELALTAVARAMTTEKRRVILSILVIAPNLKLCVVLVSTPTTCSGQSSRQFWRESKCLDKKFWGCRFADPAAPFTAGHDRARIQPQLDSSARTPSGNFRAAGLRIRQSSLQLDTIGLVPSRNLFREYFRHSR